MCLSAKDNADEHLHLNEQDERLRLGDLLIQNQQWQNYKVHEDQCLEGEFLEHN